MNKKLQEAKKTAKTEAPAESQPSKADAKKIKQLEEENADLNKKLQQANQDLSKWQAKDKSKALTEVNHELTVAKARLEVLEARKVPYTPEELALMKPPTTVTVSTNVPAKKSTRELPAGTGPLVADARRAFAAGRYEEAEQKYQQVLKQDPNNPFTLGNLAAIELEQNRLEPAEGHLTKALEIDPNDGFNVALMGILKFRQNQFDDACIILSRAVQLDPQNPEAQNYLGITLSQKGQREAAEAALRKAIQLSPKYAGAHHNLAVIYATQKPSFLELARYHYQKALDNGQPRNPDLEKLLGK